jgi:hypothetical protein
MQHNNRGALQAAGKVLFLAEMPENSTSGAKPAAEKLNQGAL